MSHEPNALRSVRAVEGTRSAESGTAPFRELPRSPGERAITQQSLQAVAGLHAAVPQARLRKRHDGASSSPLGRFTRNGSGNVLPPIPVVAASHHFDEFGSR